MPHDDDAACFISDLFEGLRGYIEIRGFPTNGDAPLQSWFWIDGLSAPSGNVLRTAQKWDKRADAYFGVNPRCSPKGDSLHIREARWLFADLDHTKEYPQVGLPDPNILVNSGGGLHAYFLLSASTQDIGQWKSVESRLVAAIGADPAVKDPARIMRVPGTHNHKPDYRTPPLVRVLHRDLSRTYTLEFWHELLPEPQTHTYTAPRQWTKGTLPSWILDAANTPAAPGSWNTETTRLGVKLRKRGVDIVTIEDLLQRKAAASGKTDQKHQAELTGIVRWLARVEVDTRD
jgi:hypothetical protein